MELEKTEYVIHIKNLNQTLNHGLTFKKVHRVYIQSKRLVKTSY